MNFLTVESLKSWGIDTPSARAFMSRKRGKPGQMKIERSGCEKSRSVGEPSLRTNQNAVPEPVALQYTRNMRTCKSIYRSVPSHGGSVVRSPLAGSSSYHAKAEAVYGVHKPVIIFFGIISKKTRHRETSEWRRWTGEISLEDLGGWGRRRLVLDLTVIDDQVHVSPLPVDTPSCSLLTNVHA